MCQTTDKLVGQLMCLGKFVIQINYVNILWYRSAGDFEIYNYPIDETIHVFADNSHIQKPQTSSVKITPKIH